MKKSSIIIIILFFIFFIKSFSYGLKVDTNKTNSLLYLPYTNIVKISYHNSIAAPYTWTTTPPGSYFGGSAEVPGGTNNKGNFASIYFLGTGLKIITTTWMFFVPAVYYVDATITDISNEWATIDGSVDINVGGAPVYQAVVDVVSDLPFGWHRVSIQNTNIPWPTIDFDGIIFDHAVGPIINTNFSDANVNPGNTNLPIMAFYCIDIDSHNITNISITNLGTMEDTTDISSVKLYYDVNGNYDYDAGDAYITNGSYSGGKWNFTVNIASGTNLSGTNLSETNLIITIDINPGTVNYGRTFRGAVLSGYVTCQSNINNNNSITNGGVYTLIVPPPTAPAILSISTVSTNQINLVWENVANETSYTLFRNTTNDSSTASPVTNTAEDVTNHNDIGLTNNTRYYYWVKAYNSTGPSGFSDMESEKTFSLPGEIKIPKEDVAVYNNYLDLSTGDPTRIVFGKAGRVEIKIYTFRGVVVKDYPEMNYNIGDMVEWDGSYMNTNKKVAGGIYIVVVKGDINKKLKMIVKN